MKAPRIALTKPTANALLAFACLAVVLPARAQPAQDLAKYDKNRNGRLDPDELAAQQADMKRAAATPVATTPAGENDILMLTPFQVDASKDKGYAAENPLAGSRLNSKLEDLAASITVVTKQQLVDTASVDVNDVFKYEAGTEGSATYTPVVTDRGTAKDTTAGYTRRNEIRRAAAGTPL